MTGAETIDGALVIEENRIAEVRREPRVSDLSMPLFDAALIGAGLIDLQVNGAFGVEVLDGADALRLLARRLPEQGITGYLPTVITSPQEAYPAFFDDFVAARSAPGAAALGIHLEGPFLSAARKGAHRLDLIENVDPELLDLFLGNADVRLVTLAPERPGGLTRIRRLAERSIVVSLGHTDACYEQFVRGVDDGASMATHLFNAMSPFGHRAPGAVGAALTDDRLTIGLIADGIHVHPAAVALAVRAKGADRIALVSDLMAAGSMPDGSYSLGGRTVHVTGNTATLSDGTLAGAVVPLVDGIRNVTTWAGLSLAGAWSMASQIPARILGMRHAGRIAVGMDADLVLLGLSLEVEATLIRGRLAFERSRTPEQPETVHR